MIKTFTEWLRLREMGGASGPFIPGNRKELPDANIEGAQPNGQPYPQHMKKKCKKCMRKK